MRTVMPGTPRPPVVLPGTPQPLAWSAFGSHPTVAATGGDGHYVVSVFLSGGRLYLGYGDWTANTGPVAVVSLDANDGSPMTHLTDVHSEALVVWREIAGAIYAPWIDTRAGYSGSVGGYVTNQGGAWTQVGVPHNYHSFDIGTTTGTDLLIAGSATDSPTIGQDSLIRSTDGGVTWEHIEPTYAVPTQYRLHSAIFLPGGVYTSGFGGGIWQDGVWTQYSFGPPDTTIEPNRPVLDDTYYSRGFAVGSDGLIYKSPTSIFPQASDGAYVYGTRRVNGNVFVYRTAGVTPETSPFIKWEPYFLIEEAYATPSTLMVAQALEVSNGRVFIGGAHGTVLSAEMP